MSEELAPEIAEETAPNAEEQMRRMSRRSFAWSVLAIGSGAAGLRWLNTRRTEDGIPWPLRRSLQTNEAIARDLFDAKKLAPTFAKSQVGELRVNGNYGLDDEVDAAAWRLKVLGSARGDSVELALATIKALPFFEMVTELKCIEGWSTITHWGGVRLRDFITRFPPTTRSGEPFNWNRPADWPEFVGLATPDGGYYVGLDFETAAHPQTLLCTQMNGAALTSDHGAPLRLVTPLKYGIKNLKRIGTLTYTNTRPADFWAERGYDWYAGH